MDDKVLTPLGNRINSMAELVGLELQDKDIDESLEFPEDDDYDGPIFEEKEARVGLYISLNHTAHSLLSKIYNIDLEYNKATFSPLTADSLEKYIENIIMDYVLENIPHP